MKVHCHNEFIISKPTTQKQIAESYHLEIHLNILST